MIVGREVKHKGYYQLDDLSVKTKGGKYINRELLINKDGVCSLVYDNIKDKFVFTSQWRPCMNDKMVEIVGGSIDEKNGCPIKAIEAEVLEEIGYKSDNITFIEDCYVSPGTITEFIKIYYIEVSDQVSDGGGHIDEDEEIDVIYMSLEEVLNYKFYDAKTIIAVNWLRFRNYVN